ncbi:MAG: ribonuclease domain-containing protein [Luteimonas sp.]
MRRTGWLIIAGLLLALWAWTQLAPVQNAGVVASAPSASGETARVHDLPGFLPPEAHATLRLVDRGGPFPHRQDGGVFGNRERLLPSRPRGYYREYTVRTPGARDRRARRIVSGGDPPSEYFYTDDHYRSFRRFEAPAGSSR